MLNISETKDGIRVNVKVQPRSSQNQIMGELEGALKVKLTAPPVEGEANKTLIRFFAGLLSIPKRNIGIITGETSRNKIVELKGITKKEFLDRIGQI